MKTRAKYWCPQNSKILTTSPQTVPKSVHTFANAQSHTDIICIQNSPLVSTTAARIYVVNRDFYSAYLQGGRKVAAPCKKRSKACP